MAEVRPGQLRRWWHKAIAWGEAGPVPAGKLFWVLGPTDHSPTPRECGWRYMQEDGVLDWHWASIIEPRSEVVSE